MRYTLRRLARSPGFVLAAVLTLALGIGINVAVLSVVNAILWNPMPVSDPGRLVVVNPPEGAMSDRGWFDELVRRAPRSVSDLAAYRFVQTAAVVGSRADVVKAEAFAGPYFDTLGVQPLVGRLPGAEDRTPVALVSEPFWMDWFGGDPAAIGSTVTLAGQALTVVGVLPKGFAGLHGGHVLGNDVWVPDDAVPTGRLNAFGRLTSGYSFSQARTEMASLTLEGASAQGQRVSRFDEVFAEAPVAFVGVSAVTFTLSGLVLLTMAANVLGLFAARQADRDAEVQVRVLLGASQRQIVALLAWEVGLIMAASTLVGALLGQAAIGPISRWSFDAGDALSFRVSPAMDWPVFAWLAASAAAMTAGIVAALRTRSGQAVFGVVSSLLSAGSTATAGLGPLRRRIIVVQIASALVLLVTSSLFVRSIASSYATASVPGIERKAVAWLAHELQGYAASDIHLVQETLVQELLSSPDFVDVGLTTVIEGSSRRRSAVVRAGSRETRVTMANATASYFDLLGHVIVAGRIDEAAWRPGGEMVVVDEVAADRLFPGESAAGRVLSVGATDPSLRVIAVVTSSTRADRQGVVFRPFDAEAHTAVVAAGRVPAERLTSSIEAAFARVRPRVVPHDVRTLAEQLGSSTGTLKSAGTIAGSLGLLAGLVAVIGIYGTVASLAVQRRREFGIRRALGASHVSIYRLTTTELMKTLIVALAGGVVCAMLASLGLRPLFRGLQAFDAVSFLVVPVVLIVASVLAALLPVRSAIQSSPVRWLKEL